MDHGCALSWRRNKDQDGIVATYAKALGLGTFFQAFPAGRMIPFGSFFLFFIGDREIAV